MIQNYKILCWHFYILLHLETKVTVLILTYFHNQTYSATISRWYYKISIRKWSFIFQSILSILKVVLYLYCLRISGRELHLNRGIQQFILIPCNVDSKWVITIRIHGSLCWSYSKVDWSQLPMRYCIVQYYFNTQRCFPYLPTDYQNTASYIKNSVVFFYVCQSVMSVICKPI